MAIRVERTRIEGFLRVRPARFADERGCLVETYNERDFAEAGMPARFVQDNQSESARGVLRGLHFQGTRPQGKLFRVVSGALYDVVVDLRSESPTFGEWAGVELSGDAPEMLYIAPGLAHGFLTLSERAVAAYKLTDFYCPGDEEGIRWDDPLLRIAWPLGAADPILSARDASLPAFDPKRRYF